MAEFLLPFEDLDADVRAMIVAGVPIHLGRDPIPDRHLSRLAAEEILRRPIDVIEANLIPMMRSLHEEDVAFVLGNAARWNRGVPSRVNLIFEGPVVQPTAAPLQQAPAVGPRGAAPSLPPVAANVAIRPGRPNGPGATPSARVPKAPAMRPPKGRGGAAASGVSAPAAKGAPRARQAAVERIRSRGLEQYRDRAHCSFGIDDRNWLGIDHDECHRRVRAFQIDFREAVVEWRKKGGGLPDAISPWTVLKRFLSDAPYTSPVSDHIYSERFIESLDLAKTHYQEHEIQALRMIYNAVYRLWVGAIPVKLLADTVEKARQMCRSAWHERSAEKVAKKGQELLQAREDASTGWGRRAVRKKLAVRDAARAVDRDTGPPTVTIVE